jgi:hypothetical protein
VADNNGVIDGAVLAELLEANAQVPDPDDAPTLAVAEESLPVFSNWEWDFSGLKPRKWGLALCDVCYKLHELTKGWPRRVDKVLFVPGANHEARYLENPAQLFAWLDAQACVDWGRASDMVSQERFLAHLQECAPRYESVEKFPHFPPLVDAFYLHPPLPVSEGQYLEQLVNFFSPLTDVDRELIRAFIISLPWGGPPGSRPAWLFTASDDDPLGGRGVGKSKVIEMCGELVGGMIEISPNEDIMAIKKRLLSPAARTLRLARIDNIKTYRFSWADLEGLITSPVISGHRMYKGEGRRPNTLTWALTLNGASLSRDMSKRVIVVKLQRRAYSDTWEHEVRSFIEQRRWRILNDIRLAIES